MARSNPTAHRYGLDERPPPLTALGLGAQGALLNVPPVVLFPLIAVQIAGGSSALADWLVFISLAATGVDDGAADHAGGDRGQRMPSELRFLVGFHTVLCVGAGGGRTQDAGGIGIPRGPVRARSGVYDCRCSGAYSTPR